MQTHKDKIDLKIKKGVVTTHYWILSILKIERVVIW